MAPRRGSFDRPGVRPMAMPLALALLGCWSDIVPEQTTQCVGALCEGAGGALALTAELSLEHAPGNSVLEGARFSLWLMWPDSWGGYPGGERFAWDHENILAETSFPVAAGYEGGALATGAGTLTAPGSGAPYFPNPGPYLVLIRFLPGLRQAPTYELVVNIEVTTTPATVDMGTLTLRKTVAEVACTDEIDTGCHAYCQFWADCFIEPFYPIREASWVAEFLRLPQAVGFFFEDTDIETCGGCLARCRSDAEAGGAVDAAVLGCFEDRFAVINDCLGAEGEDALASAVNTCCEGQMESRLCGAVCSLALEILAPQDLEPVSNCALFSDTPVEEE